MLSAMRTVAMQETRQKRGSEDIVGSDMHATQCHFETDPFPFLSTADIALVVPIKELALYNTDGPPLRSQTSPVSGSKIQRMLRRAVATMSATLSASYIVLLAHTTSDSITSPTLRTRMSSFFAMIHGAVIPSLIMRRLSECRCLCNSKALLVTGHPDDLMNDGASFGERCVQNAVFHVDVLHAVSVEMVHISGHLCCNRRETLTSAL